jgi:hypothetical protein
MLDTLGTVIGFVVTAYLIQLFHQRNAHIAVFVVKLQCRLLSENARIAREAEWLAVVEEVQGDAWKLLTALGFLRIVVPEAFALARVPVKVRAAKVSFDVTYSLLREVVWELKRHRVALGMTALIFGVGTAFLSAIGFEIVDLLLGR